jgi:hypothetical protein
MPVQHDLARHGLHETGEATADGPVDRVDRPADVPQERRIV